jgi:hypothetical protein
MVCKNGEIVKRNLEERWATTKNDRKTKEKDDNRTCRNCINDYK